MAYSMFTKPKLHNVSSIKYYPEYEYPVDQNYHYHDFQQHHENEISINTIPKNHNRRQKGTSLKTKLSEDKKCPIYVHHIDTSEDNSLNRHTFNKVSKYLNDLHSVEEEPNIGNKKQYKFPESAKKPEKNKNFVISKLEESYWANWKPGKEMNHKSDRAVGFKNLKNKGPKQKQKQKNIKKHIDYDDRTETMIELYNSDGNPNVIKHYSSEHYNENESSQSLSEPSAIVLGPKKIETQEIQTDEYSVKDAETLSRIDEENYTTNTESLFDNVDRNNDTEKDEPQEQVFSAESNEEPYESNKEEDSFEQTLNEIRDPSDESIKELMEEEGNVNSLKHTDSFILTKKKQVEEKIHFQQPKCIRLYKQPLTTTTTSFIRGGTYPLKSCLKKEPSLFNKRNIRLGRPGSPPIVTSNYCNSFAKPFRR